MIPKGADIAQFIRARNRQQSKAFCSPGAQLALRLYRAQHPTEIIALKCMDGRLNLPVITTTPPGVIKPYRNVGGKFDLGWPFFGRLILDDVENAVSNGRRIVVLSTYHFSAGDKHRGCAGFAHNTKKAYESAERLRVQCEDAFGGDHFALYPIVLGIETDKNALIFHGKRARSFDVSKYLEASEEDLHRGLRETYPDMPDRLIDDLMPLVLGNQAYVREWTKHERPVKDLQHKEQIIAVGRGFDWLHLPNNALIIGPYDPRWEDAVATAGKIVLENMRAKRIPEKDGALLLVSAPFMSVGADRGVAIEKALFLGRESERVLRDRVPSIMKRMKVLVGIVDYNTRQFHILKT